MLYNSGAFIFVFLPLTLAAFYSVGYFFRHSSSRPQLAMAVLIGASLVFYIQWRITPDLWLLLVSIALNFTIGRFISKSIERDEAKKARRLLILGVSFNLLAIAYFKYFDFLTNSLGYFLGLPAVTSAIVLPLGISFFTFTQTAFLVDCYRRKTSERNITPYALFVTIYPHLIAGPILHHATMAKQFRSKWFGRPAIENIATGLGFFILGLCKKVLIADPIATFASPVFAATANAGAVTIWEAWTGALAYTLQIYFDFSGYCDMAIGLGLMLGVRLPVNFNSPYKAVDIIDFWRRWHMTLSQFLRDYLYIPLGGNRDGQFRHYRNILITMFLGGLWHGANWTFVFWGALHGILICFNHALNGFFPTRSRTRLQLSVSRALTFIIIVATWVPFRSDTFAATWRMYGVMFGAEGVTLPDAIAKYGIGHGGGMFGNGLIAQGQFWLFDGILADKTLMGLVAVALLIFFSTCLPNTQQVMNYQDNVPEKPEDRTATLPRVIFQRPIATAAILATLFWVCVLSLTRPSQFLYFNF